MIGTAARTHRRDCGDSHGGINAAAPPGHLPAEVHDHMFRHLLLLLDRQAAVHRYLCQCHWRMEEITVRVVTSHSKLMSATAVSL